MRTGTYAATTDTSSRNKDVCMLPSVWRLDFLRRLSVLNIKVLKPLDSIIIFKIYDETSENISTMVEPLSLIHI